MAVANRRHDWPQRLTRRDPVLVDIVVMALQFVFPLEPIVTAVFAPEKGPGKPLWLLAMLHSVVASQVSKVVESRSTCAFQASVIFISNCPSPDIGSVNSWHSHGN